MSRQSVSSVSGQLMCRSAAHHKYPRQGQPIVKDQAFSKNFLRPDFIGVIFDVFDMLCIYNFIN